MIYYELKKFLGSLRNKKFLAFLLVLLIAGDVYTIYHHPINPSVYKTIHQEIQTMSKELTHMNFKAIIFSISITNSF